MAQNLTQQLLADHLIEGRLQPGTAIGIRVDQTLTQDATGTLVMLEIEAMGLDRVRTQISAQYVDHNVVQADHRNPDDHLFLRSACQRFGIWYSPPGNGVSHPTHQERFGRPGATLLGADSHTCAQGALGMLAIGAGGIEVALAMAGEPFRLRMPEVFGIRLEGELPDWVSAKDVILELLRRHDVKGGVGRVLEYHGPGLAGLSAMDRHVIANMGAELGATSSVFPSDASTLAFLQGQGRADAWRELAAEPGCSYDLEDAIDLSALEPLIALPSSPGNVRRVCEIAGDPIYQAYVGSSANPGFRDFAMAAEMVKGRVVHDGVSFDVSPTSRQILANLAEQGHLAALIAAGARVHQTGCNGCIGMGQAPATDKISLRTTPRNFPGRSGTRDDRVYLVSPETATASALRGAITDPRTLDMPCPRVRELEKPTLVAERMLAPLPKNEAVARALVRGPNIAALPVLDALPARLELQVLLVLGDNVSTDEILPAGARALPFRSNIPEIARFCFDRFDASYAARARRLLDAGRQGHAIVAGDNYGQGSSREHAALAPRYLGLRVVLARSFARIHEQNLASHGVLPLRFAPGAEVALEPDQVLHLRWPNPPPPAGEPFEIATDQGRPLRVVHALTPRQVHAVEAGGVINLVRARRQSPGASTA